MILRPSGYVVIIQKNMEKIFYIILALYFIFGIVFGSFTNVVICRIPNKEKLSFPPSHCTTCNHKLAVFDLVPIISWISLKGKCRYCEEKISVQYPIVEFLSGIIFAISYCVFGLTVQSVLFSLITLSLISIAYIDFKHYIIPNKILLWMFPLALGVAYVHSQTPLDMYSSTSPWEPLKGALVGSGILFAIAILGFFLYQRKEVMGMGDVKLLIILGMLLGLNHTLLLLFYTSLIAGGVGFILIMSGNRKKSEFIALGPYLVLSFYIVLIQSSLV